MTVVQIAVEFLRDETLSAEAKLVGLVFASYGNNRGLASPRTEQLMKDTGMGRNRVKRGRAELVRRLFLLPEATVSARGGFGRLRYRLSRTLCGVVQ